MENILNKDRTENLNMKKKSNRRSSILKPRKDHGNNMDETSYDLKSEQTKQISKKRVSFSSTKSVRTFDGKQGPTDHSLLKSQNERLSDQYAQNVNVTCTKMCLNQTLMMEEDMDTSICSLVDGVNEKWNHTFYENTENVVPFLQPATKREVEANDKTIFLHDTISIDESNVSDLSEAFDEIIKQVYPDRISLNDSSLTTDSLSSDVPNSKVCAKAMLSALNDTLISNKNTSLSVPESKHSAKKILSLLNENLPKPINDDKDLKLTQFEKVLDVNNCNSENESLCKKLKTFADLCDKSYVNPISVPFSAVVRENPNFSIQIDGMEKLIDESLLESEQCNNNKTFSNIYGFYNKNQSIDINNSSNEQIENSVNCFDTSSFIKKFHSLTTSKKSAITSKVTDRCAENKSISQTDLMKSNQLLKISVPNNESNDEIITETLLTGISKLGMVPIENVAEDQTLTETFLVVNEPNKSTVHSIGEQIDESNIIVTSVKKVFEDQNLILEKSQIEHDDGRQITVCKDISRVVEISPKIYSASSENNLKGLDDNTTRDKCKDSSLVAQKPISQSLSIISIKNILESPVIIKQSDMEGATPSVLSTSAVKTNEDVSLNKTYCKSRANTKNTEKKRKKDRRGTYTIVKDHETFGETILQEVHYDNNWIEDNTTSYLRNKPLANSSIVLPNDLNSNTFVLPIKAKDNEKMCHSTDQSCLMSLRSPTFIHETPEKNYKLLSDDDTTQCLNEIVKTPQITNSSPLQCTPTENHTIPLPVLRVKSSLSKKQKNTMKVSDADTPQCLKEVAKTLINSYHSPLQCTPTSYTYPIPVPKSKTPKALLEVQVPCSSLSFSKIQKNNEVPNDNITCQLKEITKEPLDLSSSSLSKTTPILTSPKKKKSRPTTPRRSSKRIANRSLVSQSYSDPLELSISVGTEKLKNMIPKSKEKTPLKEINKKDLKSEEKMNDSFQFFKVEDSPSQTFKTRDKIFRSPNSNFQSDSNARSKACQINNLSQVVIEHLNTDLLLHGHKTKNALETNEVSACLSMSISEQKELSNEIEALVHACKSNKWVITTLEKFLISVKFTNYSYHEIHIELAGTEIKSLSLVQLKLNEKLTSERYVLNLMTNVISNALLIAKTVNQLPEIFEDIYNRLASWLPVAKDIYSVFYKFLGCVVLKDDGLSVNFVVEKKVHSAFYLHVSFDVTKNKCKLQYALEHMALHNILDHVEMLIMSEKNLNTIMAVCKLLYDYALKISYGQIIFEKEPPYAQRGIVRQIELT